MMEEMPVKVQVTPNPNAKKFIIPELVKVEGKMTFNAPEQCHHIRLAFELLMLTNVVSVHFFENVITMTQNGISDWGILEKNVKRVIREFLPDHDPDFLTEEELRRKSLPEDVLKIEVILDKHIRPSLRMDGGDVEVVQYEDNILTIRYEGACGSCPSSQLGTLEAISSTLRMEYHPDIEVVTVE